MGAVIDEANRRQFVDHLVKRSIKRSLALSVLVDFVQLALRSTSARTYSTVRAFYGFCVLLIVFQIISFVLHSSSPMSLHYATTWSERLTFQRMLQYRMRVALGVFKD
jgi:hypothetical protein